KKEKEEGKADPTKLIIHVDFAENWSVINNKAVQGNHWVNNQISIFTAVCYQGEITQSFAIVSDDKKHDTAYALLAINKIIDLMKKNYLVTKVTIISDGAPSQFKNRFQLHEFKHWFYEMKWLFSATGHGKGAVDGIGGLLKHYATSHNLKRVHEESIKNVDDFINWVQKYTSAIKIILLPINEIERFRKKKNIEWSGVSKYNGIQKSHMWLKKLGELKSHIFIGRTAIHALNKVKNKKKSQLKKISFFFFCLVF
uniref:hypothetical protein n=1 Tax=Escherichia coli TaxID=562 RepID=UPI002915D096